jgi:mannose-6-phosphate isomerase-like protein (cupin superfamily)
VDVSVSHLDEREPFTTLDGSSIRELAGPSWNAVRNQSLAEARVPPGAQTAEHYHPQTEELYLFLAGEGRLRLGEELVEVRAGHCATIRPGIVHKLWNTGADELVLLCCCAPPYRDEDTVLTGG